MNTITIVEAWDPQQDESTIDWSGFPGELGVEIDDRHVGLREEYEPRYELPARNEGRRFGHFDGGLVLEDDDPE
ncbi:MAG TPA: hypothetical protein VHB46_19500 [Burkholderiales bacterium]|nr:hypothetical protein [Burkholderiales bacterium]